MSWSTEAKLVFAVVLCAAIIAGGVMIRDNYSPQRGMTGFAVDGSPTAANQPPLWISDTAKFTAVQDAPLVLALNELFSDPEGQALTYIATQAENMAVDLQDNTLTITPEPGFAGERVVTIMASDGENVTTQRIKVEVSLTGAQTEPVQPAAEPVLNETMPSEPVPEFNTSELPNFTTFAAPSIVQVIVNTTNPATNDTGQNVTMYAINATDTDNDPVQNITDWKLNNKSIAPVYWPFETNTSSTSAGAIRGYSLDGFNATLNTAPGTPTWISSGRLGGAYSFDGNDYLTSAASMDIGTNYSLEFWFNPASSTNWQVLVGNDMFGANYYGTLYYMPSNSPAQLWYYQGGSNYATATNIPPSGWQYIALTYNGTNTKIYVNGTLNVVGNAHTERFNNQIRLGMNIVLWGSEQYYFGSMDEVRVYNRTLTAEQVAANYRKGFENKTTDTIVPQETSTGEVWSACATPNDASADGSTVCGDNVTIKDEEPVINGTNLTGCPATINTSATLANNVSSSGTCITFGADNIELDCLGYNISYGTGGGNAVNGILANSRRNITIKNCNIIGTKATGAWDTGINFTYVNDSSVINNNITTNGSQFGNGINFVIDSNRNTIANNTILTFGANGYGIYLLYNSSGNNITGNTIRTNGSDSYAVNMINRITDTIIGNNNITTHGSAIVTATYSSRNNISDNNITSIYTTGSRYGISITLSENNTIKNNIVLAQDSSINLAYTNNNLIAGNLLTMNTTFFTPYVTYWVYTNNTLFSNNTLTTVSDGCGLMRMSAFDNNDNVISSNTFRSNNITTYTNNGGIVIDSGLNNTFAYNTITGYFGGVGIGFVITGATNYTNISNNNISMLGASSHIGIKIGSQSSPQSSDSQIIENNQITLNATSSQGILITWVSTNNTFRNNKITTTGANSYGVYIGTSNSSFFNATTINSSRGWIILFANTMNNFTNTTFMTPSGAISILPLMQLNGTRDIDSSKLNITNRRAFLNSTNLTFFNTSGIIALNNVSFIDPAPTVDWADTGAYVACPSNVCTELNYSGNTFTYNVTHFTGFGTSDTGITGCPVDINRSAVLANDVSSAGTCINIINSSLTFDCNGHTITYGTGGGSNSWGVNLSGVPGASISNVTVQNCNIQKTTSGGSGGIGIKIYYANDSVITHNNISTFDTANNHGIDSQSGIGNRITSNIIYTNGTASNNWGLYIQSSSNNNVIANNTIYTNGSGANLGMYVLSSSSNNISQNMFVTRGTGGTNYGILLSFANLNILADNYVTTTDGSNNLGIFVRESSNTTLRNNTISTNGTSANHGIMLNGSNNNILVANNVSTKGSASYGIYITQSNSSQINKTILNNPVQWIYLDVGTINNVTNTTFATDYGSINLPNTAQFNGTLDVTRAKLNITNNSAFLNSTNLTFFNTTGIITLYGITAANPEPQVDWSDSGAYVNCPADTCTELGFAGNNYVFNVTHFTGYRIFDAGSLTNITTCPFPITGNAVLGNNISSNSSCLAINGNDLTLDCMGCSISYGADGGNNEHGIGVGNARNVTIKNCYIRGLNNTGNYSHGINFSLTNNSAIINSTVITNGSHYGAAVFFYNSSGSSVAGNTLWAVGLNTSNYGAYFGTGSSSNIVENNTILVNCTGGNNTGIWLSGASGNNSLNNNSILSLGVLSGSTGIYSSSELNTITNSAITANTTYRGVNNYGIWSEYGSLMAVSGNTIKSDGWNETSRAVYLYYSTGNLTGNRISAFGNTTNFGIDLWESNATIAGNNITVLATQSVAAGARINYRSSSLFENNSITAFGDYGYIRGLWISSDYSVVNNNNISTNGSFLQITSGRYNHAVYINAGNSNNFTNNTITPYGYGTNYGIDVVGGDNNIFTNNTIRANAPWWADWYHEGIVLEYSADRNILQGNVVSTSCPGECYALNIYSSSNNTVRNNSLIAGFTGAFTVDSVDVTTNSMDNTIDSNIIQGSANVVLLSTGVLQNKVVNNTIIMSQVTSGNGVYLYSSAQNNIVANNTIRYIEGVSYDNRYGIYLNSLSSNNIIDNNTIKIIGYRNDKGIFIATNSNNNTLTNNLINVSSDANNIGIYVLASRNINILNNRIMANASGSGYAQGIVAQNSPLIIAANNTVLTNGSTNNYGINISGASDNSSYIDNNITTAGSDSYGIYLAGSQNDSFINNKINTTGDGLMVTGTELIHFLTHEFAATNTVNDSPIYYYGGARSSPACPNNQVLNAPSWAQIDFMSCNNVTLQNYLTSEATVLVNASNMTIAGNSFRDSRYGLRLFLNTTNAFVENNTINATNSTFQVLYGLWLYMADNNTIRYNNISKKSLYTGESAQADMTVYLADSTQNNLTDNTIFSDCKYGVVLGSSRMNFVARNNITAIQSAGYCTAFTFSGAVENTVTNNTFNLASNSINQNTGVVFSTSYNNTFANNTILGPDTGVSISYSIDNTVDRNSINSQTDYGVDITYSHLNKIKNNVVNLTTTLATSYAARVYNSENNTIANNTLLSLGAGTAGHTGIYFDTSENNTIDNNTIRTNGTSGNTGIYLASYSNYNTFANNIIVANGTSTDNYGIQISYSVNNTFRNNTVIANGSSLSHAVFMQYEPVNNTFIGNSLTAGRDSAAVYAIVGTGSVFSNNTLNVFEPSAYWFYGASGTKNNFTNTTFATRNGSISIIPLIELNATNITQANLNITYNRAYLNTTNLSFFNTTAVITLSGLAYSNAVPTVDFDDSGVYVNCPASVCTVLGYIGGTLAFSAAHFTSYSSQEAPISNISNLTLTKTDYPDPVTASTNLTYKINVSVRGNGTAFNVTVNDTYPLQVIYLTSQPSPVSGTNNTWILGNLSQGTNISINITVLVLNITDGAVINNTANASFQNESGTLLQLQVTENTTVSNPPVFNQSSVVIVKTGSPNPVNASANLTYQINVTSAGNGTAYNVTVNDTYPAQVIYLASQPAPLAGTNNTWILGNLTPGTSILINATVLVMNVSDGTVINNTVNVTFQNETSALLSAVDTESTTVSNPPVIFNLSNVSIRKTDNPDPVNASGILAYQINVTSTGNGTAYNVTVNDTYPDEVIYLTSVPAPTAGNNSWTLGSLTAGTNFSINITVLVRNISNGSAINNNANVTFQNETSGAFNYGAFAETTVLNPRLVNSTIINSNISNCTIINSTVINSTKSDCTIINSYIINSTNNNTVIIGTNETNSFDNDTVVDNSIIIDSTKINSTINGSTKIGSTIINSNVINSTNHNSTLINTNETNSTDINSTVDHSIIIDTTKINAIINNSNITNSTINWTIVINSTINSTNLTNCSVINSTLNGINNQSCTYLNFNPNLNPPIPPGPGPQPGGGGGGGGGGGVRRNQTTAQPPAIKCTESWICDDWSACFGNRQVRECSEVNACGTRNYVPATERQCVKAPETVPAPEVIPPLAEEIKEIKAPETVPSAEKKPLLEIPAVTAMCPVAPIVLDAALILFVLFILAYFLMMLRKKAKGSHLFLDVPAVVILLMMAFNYATCAELLLLQYIIYAVLVIFSLILHLIPARQEERISETPGTEEFYKHLEELDRKLASIEGAKPRSSVKQIRKTPEEERIERELERIAREKVEIKIRKAEPLPVVKAPVARAPEQRKVPAGKAEPKSAQVNNKKFYSRLDDIDRKLAKEENAKPRAVKAVHIAKPAEDKRIEQEFNRLAHVKIAVPKQGLFSRIFKPKQAAKPEPVKPVVIAPVKQKPIVARQTVVKPAQVKQAPQPKPVVVKPVVIVKQKPSKDKQQFYGKMNQLDAELAKVERRLKAKRGKSK